MDEKQRIEAGIAKPNFTAYIDVPYPRRLWDDIRKGNHVDFHELVRTGMVMAYITPFDEELESIQNGVVSWAERNKDAFLTIDMTAEQKWLDRFLELNKNNDRIDHLGLNQLFEKICLYSSVLSEHQDDEHPSLVSLKTRIIKFKSGKYTSYYIAISSHPDLIEEQRLEQMMDSTRQRFEATIDKLKSDEKSTVTEKSIAYNTINITGSVINSSIQQATVDSTINQTIQQNDLKAINDLISKLESTLDKLQISDKQKQDICTNIDTIKSQTKSSKPRKQIVMDALSSISGILQALPAGQTIVTEIMSNLGHVLKIFGIG